MRALVKPIVVILCGGRGTRLQEHSQAVPKPLIEVGGRPIVWHVIQMYLAHGFRRFLLLTGYRAEQVQAFAAAAPWPAGAQIDVPGHRHRHARPASGCDAAAPALDEERFCLAYADGVADIDLARLLDDHRAHGQAATMARRPAPAPVRGGAAGRRRRGARVHREAPQRAVGQRRASSASSARRSTCSGPAAPSSASRSSAWPPPASCAPSAMRASGSAWTPTRTGSP